MHISSSCPVPPQNPGSKVALKDQTLRIEGTEDNDEIEVYQDAQNLSVKINGQEHLVPSKDVAKIELKALGGNDTIEFIDARSGSGLKQIPLLIDAGDGNDFVSTGDSDDTIYGGKGDDEIYAAGGVNLLDGGEGNDFLKGDTKGKGNKTTYIGGSGQDQTYKEGHWGNKTLRN